MSEQTNNTDQSFSSDELPDAPPKRKIKLSWPGKIGIATVLFWSVIVVIGPTISPYHEADILDEELFILPGSDEIYPETEFQPPSKIVYLGSDDMGQELLSRSLYGARTRVRVSAAAALVA